MLELLLEYTSAKYRNNQLLLCHAVSPPQGQNGIDRFGLVEEEDLTGSDTESKATIVIFFS